MSLLGLIKMSIKQLTKNKRIRLKGAALRKLYEYVWQRDGGQCALCHKPVEYGTPPHHREFGRDKEDRPDNLLQLCIYCHVKAHAPGQKEIEQRCLEYIKTVEG